MFFFQTQSNEHYVYICCYVIYADSGQVCLSLLGTWDGPGWESGTSNVYQVLSTILYMILGAKHPYYMEPDYGTYTDSAHVYTSIYTMYSKIMHLIYIRPLQQL